MRINRKRHMEKLNKIIAFGLCLLVVATMATMFSCKRLPSQTIHDTIGIPTYIYVDSNRLKEANKDFNQKIDTAIKATEELQKKEPCAELANKAKNNIIGARNAKQRIDTVYKQAECRIEPVLIQNDSVVISANAVNGKIVIDYKFKQVKVIQKDKSWWDFWQTKVAFCVIVLAVLALIFKR